MNWTDSMFIHKNKLEHRMVGGYTNRIITEMKSHKVAQCAAEILSRERKRNLEMPEQNVEKDTAQTTDLRWVPRFRRA